MSFLPIIVELDNIHNLGESDGNAERTSLGDIGG